MGVGKGGFALVARAGLGPRGGRIKSRIRIGSKSGLGAEGATDRGTKGEVSREGGEGETD